MQTYLTHDFQINCPWTLPDGVLRCSDQVGSTGISVSEGVIDWSSAAAQERENFEIQGGSHFFYWPILGSVRFENTGGVTISPLIGAPEGIIPHAILGPVSAHWMLLQGKLPLHANCVAVDGELLAVVGPSGAGKSSLAAALICQGALPHADDVISVEPTTGHVPFGAARIKLNPDILDVLKLPYSSLSPLYHGLSKLSVAFESPKNTAARPLKTIYRLVDAESEQSPSFNEVGGFPLAMTLVSELYRPEVALHTLGLQALVSRSAQLVGKVKFFDLSRQKSLATIDQLAKTVIEHFKSLR